MLGTYKYQIRLCRILQHTQGIASQTFVGDDVFPGLSKITGTENRATEITPAVIVHNHKGFGFVVPTGMHLCNPGSDIHAFDVSAKIGPGLAPVSRKLYVAVVGTNPDYVAVFG